MKMVHHSFFAIKEAASMMRLVHPVRRMKKIAIFWTQKRLREFITKEAK